PTETNELAYRGPEAILQMEWNSKVDIWNVAALVMDAL
ncbi:hypothetical protein ACJ72_08112, partial [Emergomyces africanus]